MKLTRRTFIKIAGAAGVAGTVGCGAGDDPDGELPPDYDSGPDETFDASGEDLDADLTKEDAAAEDDVALDAGADAGVDVPAEPPRDVPAMDAGRDVPPVDVPRVDVPRADVPPVDVPRVDVPRVDSGVITVPHPDFRSLPERLPQFPLGVMAGDATHTSVMFWTKHDGDSAVTLRVLEMNGDRIAAVRFNGRVTPSGAGFVRAIVTGLRPNKQHLYAFLVGPVSSPTGRSSVGRVQTAIGADSLAPIVFGGTSCTNQNARPYPVHQAASADNLDFFIHAGDHIYADYGDNAVTLPEYRAKYSASWAASGMRALHGATGQYLTWDDHEVFNNWNPETTSRARVAAARAAFFEHRATRRNTTDPDRIWRSFRWGRTAEVFILDCRGERRPSTRSEDPSRPSTYISRRQMDWLKAGLRSSPCVFKFIVNSVPIVDRGGADSDNWNGYASQRREILNHIDNNRLRGVVWLSGDVHFGGVCRVEAAGPWSDIWEVVMGPSGSNRDSRPDVRPAQWPVLVHDIHNYVLFHADPASRTLTVDFINGDGNRIADSRWTHTF